MGRPKKVITTETLPAQNLTPEQTEILMNMDSTRLTPLPSAIFTPTSSSQPSILSATATATQYTPPAETGSLPFKSTLETNSLKSYSLDNPPQNPPEVTPSEECVGYSRLPNGLVRGVNYKFGEDHLVNWKAMIPSKYLMVKKDKVDDVKRKYKVENVNDLDLSTVEDYFLYIKLGGMNYLATLRGYNKLVYSIPYVSDTKAVANCEMHFIPNFENPEGLTCSGVASASIYNVSSGFESFIETFAENRALTRCVRRALRINVVTEEELGGDDKKLEREAFVRHKMAENAGNTNYSPNVKSEAPQSQVLGHQPYAVLAAICEIQVPPVKFEALKMGAIRFKESLTSNPETWTDFKDINANDSYTLINKLKAPKKG